MPNKRAKGKSMVGLYLTEQERVALRKVMTKRDITITDLFKEALMENARRYGIKIGDGKTSKG